MIKLYDYQQQALEAEVRHRAEHPNETRLAIVLPTGTGKGTILAERAARHVRCEPGDKVLILVHTDELVQDLAARCVLANDPRRCDTCHGSGIDEHMDMCSSCGGNRYAVGIVKAERDEVDADIIVASVQTLANPERRARIRDVGLVIVDEFDYGMSAYIPILRHFGCMEPEAFVIGNADEMAAVASYLDKVNPTPALGFTATPERTDGAGLGQAWQDVVFTRDISWAVRKGFLVQPVGYRLEIDAGVNSAGYDDPTMQASWSADAAALDSQLCDSIAPERIVEKWQELAKDRQTIVFAPLVRSARMIAFAFQRQGVEADVIHGDMPDHIRRERIADFKIGRIQVLVNAMVLTRGFDHPGVGCVIVARPTKSRPLFIQMAGRGLRRQPGIPVEDQDCILITLADATADICSVADLSDRLTDRKADGALTVMEDAFDIGKDLEDSARHWTGKVNASEFDPIVARSSKVWQRTKGGHWFLPISTEREYVFLRTHDVYLLDRPSGLSGPVRTQRLHADLPDLELAMQVAEDEATERGGDLGALLADRSRPWRKGVPKPGDKMYEYAIRLGLHSEVRRIVDATAGGKAGKVSDLIRRVEASRAIDRAADRINAREATA